MVQFQCQNCTMAQFQCQTALWHVSVPKLRYGMVSLPNIHNSMVSWPKLHNGIVSLQMLSGKVLLQILKLSQKIFKANTGQDFQDTAYWLSFQTQPTDCHFRHSLLTVISDTAYWLSFQTQPTNCHFSMFSFVFDCSDIPPYTTVRHPKQKWNTNQHAKRWFSEMNGDTRRGRGI